MNLHTTNVFSLLIQHCNMDELMDIRTELNDLHNMKLFEEEAQRQLTEAVKRAGDIWEEEELGTTQNHPASTEHTQHTDGSRRKGYSSPKQIRWNQRNINVLSSMILNGADIHKMMRYFEVTEGSIRSILNKQGYGVLNSIPVRIR